MKGMKGKLLKKLKSIKPIGTLKQDRVLHVNAADGFVENFPKSLILKVQTHLIFQETAQEKIKESRVTVQEPEIIDVSELMRDLEEEDMEIDDDTDNKENIGPQMKAKDSKDSVPFKDNVEKSTKLDPANFRQTPLSEIDISSFRRPDLNSGTLFDPNLLAAFEEAVKEHNRMNEAERLARIEQENAEKCREEAERKARIEQENLENSREEAARKARIELDNHEKGREEEKNARIEEENLEKNREEAEGNARIELENIPKNREEVEENATIEQENLEGNNDIEPPYKIPPVEDDDDPLLGFEEKCPPGGDESVIFYTTSLRGIRKTFEDCSSIRFLLESFRVLFFERDVSMHMKFKEELWEILGGKAVPPRLFIKGRYIGGAEEVLRLHEQGKFRLLFDGVPVDSSNVPCEGCAGIRFVLCSNCNGSHKVIADDGLSSQCLDCNENGLIICPICC